MAAQPEDQPQFSDDESIESTITYQEQKAPQPQAADALNYLFSVKVAFGAKSQEYQYFLDLMKDFKAERITTPIVAARVRLLFSEHQELIEGFNQFMPAGYKISPLHSRRPAIRFEEAVRYGTKVKAAFSQDKKRYTSFLQLLNRYRKAEMSVLELSQKMCELLHDRQDLLEEFFDYMSYKATFQHVVNSAMKDETVTNMKMKSMSWFYLGVSLSVLAAFVVGIAVGVLAFND